jgi:FlaA1/EpsC-like NDP-sugar epimerase
VVPFFKSFKKDSVFPITDPDMTRFNILLEEGIQFVFDCIKIMEGTEIFVPKIKSYKILDLLQSIAPNAKTKIVGIRSGEKIHEEMVSTNDSISTIEFNKFFIIYPLKILDQKKYINFIKKFKGKKVKKGFSYNSKNNIFLSVNEIKKLINTLE